MCAFLARSSTDGLFLKPYRPKEVKNKTEYWTKFIGLVKALATSWWCFLKQVSLLLLVIYCTWTNH